MTKTALEIAKEKQPDCIDKNGHLVISPIIKIAKSLDCPFIAFIGEKRVGKTYGCVGYGLKEFYKTGFPMFYIRRYDKTFTENICGDLGRAHKQDIINFSKGSHNDCELRGKYFDLVRNERNASGAIIKRNRQHFIFCRSLNNIETETADDKGDISCAVYDEFLTRGNEIKDEFNKIMIAHANATAKRTDRFIPFFLCGNTVSRDSETAAAFGMDLHDVKRGLNIFTNSKGETRLVCYYLPETKIGTESAKTYYDRFENDHINMISHGDWTLGTYRIANAKQLSVNGFSMLATHKKLAVKIKVITEGIQPRVVIQKPDNLYSVRISSGLSKTAVNFLPTNIAKLITSGFLVAESPQLGEDFRDICKHINGGQPIVSYYE